VKRPRLLFALIGAIAGTVAVVLAVVFFALPPAESEDPFRNVALATERSQYAFGETIAFVLTNDGPLTYNFHDWAVERLVDAEWEGVECHVRSLELLGLGPGDSITFHWTVENEDPQSCGSYPVLVPVPVEPGQYRGIARLSVLAQDGSTRGDPFAPFEVA
jgi:hypothetical protein